MASASASRVVATMPVAGFEMQRSKAAFFVGDADYFDRDLQRYQAVTPSSRQCRLPASAFSYSGRLRMFSSRRMSIAQ